MDIVFMGSAAFALPALRALADSHHNILEMVAQPDKPAGRGMKVRACPTAAFAGERGIPLNHPASVRNPEEIEHFRNLAPDLIVVIAYGKILPRELIDIPAHGCINVHASLLPKYRGAAPINWAIVNGERETGVTTMFINEELDSGDVLLAAKTPIGESETAPELHDRLAAMGADLLKATLSELADGKLRPIPQDHAKATYAPMIEKEDGRIDWTMGARAIRNRVRGFAPWPGAFTALRGRGLRIHIAELYEGSGRPGEVIEAGDRLCVACGEGALKLVEIQMEGGKRMTAVEFMRGHAIERGEKLG
ncbi:MAG: methionyl-tRNA formyltransferase [Proteobacteria bacterium]|nr:methionyl-tRNA formyltransferase [Pseudomonadota bacterium]